MTSQREIGFSAFRGQGGTASPHSLWARSERSRDYALECQFLKSTFNADALNASRLWRTFDALALECSMGQIAGQR